MLEGIDASAPFWGHRAINPPFETEDHETHQTAFILGCETCKADHETMLAEDWNE